MKTRKFLAVAIVALGFQCTSFAQKTVIVGGAAMYPDKNIIENAVNSTDHTTLVEEVKATGLVETLQGKGLLTVFAPTNEAFGKLPAGNVETLLKPKNIKTLQTILTYHVVAGKMNSSDIAKAIKAAKGKTTLKTVSGGTLTDWIDGKNLYIIYESGSIFLEKSYFNITGFRSVYYRNF